MIMYIIRIILAILSTYRIAQLIAYDKGPLDLIKKMRLWFGKKAANNPDDMGWSSVADLVNCAFCIGIWTAFLCSFLVFFPSSFGDFVLLMFGLAGGQTYLESRSNTNER